MAFFFSRLAAILGFQALLMLLLVWAFRSERFQAHRLSPMPPLKVSRAAHIGNLLTSSTLSLIIVFGSTYLLFDVVLHQRATAWGTILLQAAGILTVYDFAYYGLHRGMHHKKLMRWIHGVHHRARNPSAIESFYLHPAELVAGLFLLMASTWLIGPVHIHAFLVAFFIYSSLNILVHSGLVFGRLLLAPIDLLARKHHVHHNKDFGKNYASLTPLPDLLFGTSS